MSWDTGSSGGGHQKGSSGSSGGRGSNEGPGAFTTNQTSGNNDPSSLPPGQSGLSRNRLRLNFGPPLFGEDLTGSGVGSGSAGVTTAPPPPAPASSASGGSHQSHPSRPSSIQPIPISVGAAGGHGGGIGGRPWKLADGGPGNSGGFGPPGGSASGLSTSHLYSTSGKLSISPELTFDFTAEDLEDLGEIGRGAYGTVNKMLHKTSSTTIAVKRLRCTVDEREQKKLMMDLEVVMRSNACPFIVKFYGAVFKEGDCWICMELMDSSLEQFYKFVYRKMDERISEGIIGQIALATVRALSYLKEELKIIHRDVKPSNILLDKQGNIKLCDFGISGQLVDSIAQSRDAGCRPYMAPERIDPSSAKGYDIRSDVWSLGITLIEISTGKFPYPKWNSIFEQLSQVVQGDPPRLTTTFNSPNGGQIQFSPAFVDFVNTCLIKSELQRPKYARLLKHPFILRSAAEKIDVKSYFSDIFDAMGPALLQQRLDDLLLYDDDDY